LAVFSTIWYDLW